MYLYIQPIGCVISSLFVLVTTLMMPYLAPEYAYL